jgi:hypothetical protein
MDFYEIIDSARDRPASASTPSADPNRLKTELAKLGDDDVFAFGAAFHLELIRLNRWPVWDVGYVAAGGMSDDSFHYFRSWLIGKGSAAVEQAVSDPDGLVAYLDDSDLDNELLEYVAIDLLDERGIDSDPRDSSPESADDPPRGVQVDDETSLAVHYPRVTAWRQAR